MPRQDWRERLYPQAARPRPVAPAQANTDAIKDIWDIVEARKRREAPISEPPKARPARPRKSVYREALDIDLTRRRAGLYARSVDDLERVREGRAPDLPTPETIGGVIPPPPEIPTLEDQRRSSEWRQRNREELARLSREPVVEDVVEFDPDGPSYDYATSDILRKRAPLTVGPDDQHWEGLGRQDIENGEESQVGDVSVVGTEDGFQTEDDQGIRSWESWVWHEEGQDPQTGERRPPGYYRHSGSVSEDLSALPPDVQEGAGELFGEDFSLVLKARGHETFDKAVIGESRYTGKDGEHREGHVIVRKFERDWSIPKDKAEELNLPWVPLPPASAARVPSPRTAPEFVPPGAVSAATVPTEEERVAPDFVPPVPTTPDISGPVRAPDAAKLPPPPEQLAEELLWSPDPRVTTEETYAVEGGVPRGRRPEDGESRQIPPEWLLKEPTPEEVDETIDIRRRDAPPLTEEELFTIENGALLESPSRPSSLDNKPISNRQREQLFERAREARPFVQKSIAALDPSRYEHLLSANQLENVVMSLIMSESSFRKGSKSEKHAMGHMQLTDIAILDMTEEHTRGAGRDDRWVVHDVDDPHDIEQNIAAGVEFLVRGIGKYNNVNSGLASFNFGYGNVDDAIEAGTMVDGIPPSKGDQVREYVEHIIDRAMPFTGKMTAAEVRREAGEPPQQLIAPEADDTPKDAWYKRYLSETLDFLGRRLRKSAIEVLTGHEEDEFGIQLTRSQHGQIVDDLKKKYPFWKPLAELPDSGRNAEAGAIETVSAAITGATFDPVEFVRTEDGKWDLSVAAKARANVRADRALVDEEWGLPELEAGFASEEAYTEWWDNFKWTAEGQEWRRKYGTPTEPTDPRVDPFGRASVDGFRIPFVPAMIFGYSKAGGINPIGRKRLTGAALGATASAASYLFPALTGTLTMNLMKGSIMLPQFVLGVAEVGIASADAARQAGMGPFLSDREESARGSYAGKITAFLTEEMGYAPSEAISMIDEFATDAFKQQNAGKPVMLDENGDPLQLTMDTKEEYLKGVWELAKYVASNSHLTVAALAQSLPLMAGGAYVGGVPFKIYRQFLGAARAAGRTFRIPAPKILSRVASSAEKAGVGTAGAAARGMAGEGMVSGGLSASQYIEETGTITPFQALTSMSVGTLTGLISKGSSWITRNQQLFDPDTLLAGGTGALRTAGVKQAVKSFVGSAVKEGFLEELPQGIQEQIGQNLGSGRPLTEGLDEQIVFGTIIGMWFGSMASVPGIAERIGFEGRTLEGFMDQEAQSRRWRKENEDRWGRGAGTQYVVERDAEGNPVLDEAGEPKFVRDAKGEPIERPIESLEDVEGKKPRERAFDAEGRVRPGGTGAARVERRAAGVPVGAGVASELGAESAGIINPYKTRKSTAWKPGPSGQSADRVIVEEVVEESRAGGGIEEESKSTLEVVYEDADTRVDALIERESRLTGESTEEIEARTEQRLQDLIAAYAIDQAEQTGKSEEEVLEGFSNESLDLIKERMIEADYRSFFDDIEPQQSPAADRGRSLSRAANQQEREKAILAGRALVGTYDQDGDAVTGTAEDPLIVSRAIGTTGAQELSQRAGKGKDGKPLLSVLRPTPEQRAAASRQRPRMLTAPEVRRYEKITGKSVPDAALRGNVRARRAAIADVRGVLEAEEASPRWERAGRAAARSARRVTGRRRRAPAERERVAAAQPPAEDEAVAAQDVSAQERRQRIKDRISERSKETVSRGRVAADEEETRAVTDDTSDILTGESPADLEARGTALIRARRRVNHAGEIIDFESREEAQEYVRENPDSEIVPHRIETSSPDYPIQVSGQTQSVGETAREDLENTKQELEDEVGKAPSDRVLEDPGWVAIKDDIEAIDHQLEREEADVDPLADAEKGLDIDKFILDKAREIGPNEGVAPGAIGEWQNVADATNAALVAERQAQGFSVPRGDRKRYRESVGQTIYSLQEELAEIRKEREEADVDQRGTDTGTPEGVQPKGRQEAGETGEPPDVSGEGVGEGDGGVQPSDRPGTRTRPSAGTGDAGVDATGGTGQAGAADTGEGQAPAPVHGTTPRRGVGEDAQIAQDDIDALNADWKPIERVKRNLAAIEVVKQLRDENRLPTAEEKSILIQYGGWGGLSVVFDKEKSNLYGSVKKAIVDSFGEEAYKEAESSTQFAHYTSTAVISKMWEAAERLGFKGGKVLEPGAGIGLFLAMQPAGSRPNTNRQAIEKDPITAAILKALNPATQVNDESITGVYLPEGSVDLAIGNPPFSQNKPIISKEDAISIHGREGYDGPTGNLHNYFFGRAIEALRPGGILIFVTSQGTMDSSQPPHVKARTWMAQHADLVGGVRLPSGAFQHSSGTAVGTDILVFQKRTKPLAPKEAKEQTWVKTEKTSLENELGGKSEHKVNPFFLEDGKGVVAGTLMAGRGLYSEEEKITALTREPRYPNDINLRIDPVQSREAYDSRLNEYLNEWIATLPENIAVDPGTVSDEPVTVREKAPKDVPLGSFTVRGAGEGVLYRNVGTFLAKVPNRTKPEIAVARSIRGQVRLAQALNDHIQIQLDPSSTTEDVKKSLKALQAAYKRFRAKESINKEPINSPSNRRATKGDKRLELIHQLEVYTKPEKSKKKGVPKSKRVGTATESRILKERVLFPRKTPTTAASAKDALALTLGEGLSVDLEKIASMTGRNEEQILDELKGLIFETPDGMFVTREQYLSGNVREKLRAAERAVNVGGQTEFAGNVEALKGVLPEDVGLDDLSEDVSTGIKVTLGQRWVPISMYQEFANYLFTDTSDKTGRRTGTRSESRELVVQQDPETGRYQLWVKDTGWQPAKERFKAIKAGPKATTTWGVQQLDEAKTNPGSGVNLLNRLLNLQSSPPSNAKAHTAEENRRQTQAIQVKFEDIQNEWQQWIRANPERSEQLLRIYNDTFNTNVVPAYDGSHLTFPGMAVINPKKDVSDQLRPHQKNAVWRILSSGKNTGLAHVVGSGKTYTMAAAAMEMRRTGQAKKPMITVPNPLLGQFVASFRTLYPNAKLLVWSNSEYKDHPTEFLSKIAIEDWDAVIVPHSRFTMFPISEEREAKILADQLDEVEATMRGYVESAEAEGVSVDDNNPTVKAIAKARGRVEGRKRELQTRLAKRTESLSGSFAFEQLGIDALFVDEAHEFKNVPFSTAMTNVKGIPDPSNPSQRGSDMLAKVDYINEVSGNRNVVFATGTPVTNSLAETYFMMRYLDPTTLKALGIEKFDDFAAVFSTTEDSWESRPGESKPVVRQRLTKMKNAPEAIRAFRESFDVLTNDDLDLPLPRLKGGAPENVSVQGGSNMKAYQKELNDRLEALDGGGMIDPETGEVTEFDPTVDNFLKVTGDARAAGLDLRLVGRERDDSFKLLKASEEIAKRYKQYSHVNGTQLVFSDLGVPSKGTSASGESLDDSDDVVTTELKDADGKTIKFSLYEELKQLLVKGGIPEKEIEFAQSHKTVEEKIDLQRRVNNGEVRVVIGSTLTLGQGTNMQDRLVAVHHLDVPWTPSKLEQRDGRILRQGNLLAMEDSELYDPDFEVEILRYLQLDSFDEMMWEIQLRKATMVDALMRGDPNIREIEDVGAIVLNAQMSAAEASGDPNYMRSIKLEAEINKLRIRAMNEEVDRRRAVQSTELLPLRQERLEEAGAELQAFQESLSIPEPFSITIKESIDGDAKTQVYLEKEGAKAKEITKVRKRANEAIRTLIDAADVATLGPNQGVDIGEYAGVRLEVQKGNASYEVVEVFNKDGKPLGEDRLLVPSVKLIATDGTITIDIATISNTNLDEANFIARIKSSVTPESIAKSIEFNAEMVEKTQAEWQESVKESRKVTDSQKKLEEKQKELAEVYEAMGRVRTAEGGPPDAVTGVDEDEEVFFSRRIPPPGGEAAEDSTDEGEAAEDKTDEDKPVQEQYESAIDEVKAATDAAIAESKERSRRLEAGLPATPEDEAPPGASTDPLPVEAEELIAFAKDLTNALPGGAMNVVKRLRGDQRGNFRKGRIKLVRDLWSEKSQKENPLEVAWVIAHELGHLVDFLPEGKMKRGNIIGHIKGLHKYLKKEFIGEDGTALNNDVLRRELMVLQGVWRGWEFATAESFDADGKVIEGGDYESIFYKEDYPEEQLANQEMTESDIRHYHQPAELYADAFSAMMVAPKTVEEHAPAFHEAFLANLAGANPEFNDGYQKLQELLQGGSRAELHGRRFSRTFASYQYSEAHIKALQEERVRRQNERDWNIVLQLRHGVLDKNDVVIEAINRAEKKGKVIPKDFDPRRMLSRRNYLGAALEAWTERNVQPIYRAVMDVDFGDVDFKLTKGDMTVDEMERINLQTHAPSSWDIFGKYLEMLRIAKGDRQVIANPYGQKAAEEGLAFYEAQIRASEDGDAKWKVLVDQQKAFGKMVQAVQAEAHNSQLYSDELFEEMKRNNYYATFRSNEHLDKRITPHIVQQVGMVAEGRNPATNTVYKMLSTLRAIEHQNVKMAAFAQLQRHGHEVGDMGALTATRRGKHGELLKQSERNKDSQTVTYFKNGKLHGYDVDPYIADSLNNRSAGENLPIIGLIKHSNDSWFRPVFTTMNLGFQGYNVFRDFARFYKAMSIREEGKLAGISFGRALKLYWKAIPLARVRAFGLSEKPQQKHLDANEEMLDAQQHGILGQMLSDYVSGKSPEHVKVLEEYEELRGGRSPDPQKRFNLLHRSWSELLGFIKATGDFTEALPKAAALYHFKGEGKVADISEEDKQFIRERVGSPDFLAGGTFKPVTNNLFIFSNAILQGWSADISTAIEPRTRMGYAWKTIRMSVIPKLILAAASAGWFDIGDDEDESKLEEVLKSAASWAGVGGLSAGLPGLVGGAAYGVVTEATETGRKSKETIYEWLWGDDSVKDMINSISGYDLLTKALVIPLGRRDDGRVMYLAIPQDDTGRVVGATLWHMMGMNSENENFLEAMTSVFAYTVGQVPVIAPVVKGALDTTKFMTGQNIHDAFREKMLWTNEEMETMSRWDKTKMFIGHEIHNFGFGFIVPRFFMGDERPREKVTWTEVLTEGQTPTLETFIEGPLLYNFIGRFLRFSNYGESQQYDAERRKVAQKSREGREIIQESISTHVKEWEENVDEEDKRPPNVTSESRSYFNRLYGGGGYPTPLATRLIEGYVKRAVADTGIDVTGITRDFKVRLPNLASRSAKAREIREDHEDLQDLTTSAQQRFYTDVAAYESDIAASNVLSARNNEESLAVLKAKAEKIHDVTEASAAYRALGNAEEKDAMKRRAVEDYMNPRMGMNMFKRPLMEDFWGWYVGGGEEGESPTLRERRPAPENRDLPAPEDLPIRGRTQAQFSPDAGLNEALRRNRRRDNGTMVDLAPRAGDVSRDKYV